MPKALKIIITVIIVVAVLIAGFFLFLTFREYKPAPVVSLSVPKKMHGDRMIEKEDRISIVTFNTGYAGLDASADFFMDGGKGVNPSGAGVIDENLHGIVDILEDLDADVYFLQEVDRGSRRSFYIDEMDFYTDSLGMPGIYAPNFRADFVPYPMPPIGKVESGLVTITSNDVNSASRLALPESFSWPVKTCNLKRCILELRLPIKGTDKELVLMNFHLEAYDDGEGKIAQINVLKEKLSEEYYKGNYVIAGGDFNQTVEGIDKYPIVDEENWVPGVMNDSDLPEHFEFAVSDNEPTCRSLAAPYSGNYQDTQVWVIDGFIVSDNIKIKKLETQATDFEYSDHQPVYMEFTFK